MRRAFDPKELKNRVLLADGGFATSLFGLGLADDVPPERWNLERPEVVRQLCAEFVAAGSRVILANTFGANRLRIAASGGTPSEVGPRATAGVALARAAAAGRAFVAAPIGPTGRDQLGRTVTRGELDEVFAEQAQALASAGPDLLVVETMVDLDEAESAVRAAAATGLPVVATMSFHGEQCRTPGGTTPGEAVARLSGAGASILGANCGVGLDGFVCATKLLREAWSGPLWVKPSAGLPRRTGDHWSWDAEPAAFARGLLELVELGANVIGGCCGTTPAFVAAMHAALTSSANPPWEPFS